MKLGAYVILVFGLAACTIGEKSASTADSIRHDTSVSSSSAVALGKLPAPTAEKEVTSFFIEVPATTSSADRNAAIDSAFMEYFKAHADTSMRFEEHSIRERAIFASDEEPHCATGYIMMIHQRHPSECCPDSHLYYVYFFSGIGPRYEVFDSPLVLQGTAEDVDREVDLTFDYSGGYECPFLGWHSKTAIQAVGIKMLEELQLYRWNEGTHRLEKVFNQRLQLSQGGGEPQEIKWGLRIVESSGKPYGIDVQASGDSSYMQHYVWRSGKYQRQ